MKNPKDIAQSPKARSRSTAISLNQEIIPVPNDAIVNTKVLSPEPKFGSLLIRVRPKAIAHQPRRIGVDHKSNPLRIQTVILTPINKIIMIAIDRYIFFSFNKKKSIRIPMVNMQAVADNIAVLLYSGGKSGVPRMNAKNHMKLTPTEVLARKKADCLRPVIKIKPVSAAVDRKDRTRA